MTRLGAFLTVASLMWPCLAVLADEQPSIEAFVGNWQGREITSADRALAPEALGLRIEADADGFDLSWHDLGADDRAHARGEEIDARFVPTDRPGVYHLAPQQGSLLSSMFASPTTGNPLEGETLLWARVDGVTLAVYSMQIDPNGGFDLDHYSWTRTESGLRLTFAERTEESDVETRIEGELVAEGG